MAVFQMPDDSLARGLSDQVTVELSFDDRHLVSILINHADTRSVRLKLRVLRLIGNCIFCANSPFDLNLAMSPIVPKNRIAMQ